MTRALGLFDMTMLVMGTVIGAGIFMVPQVVAQLVHRAPLVLGAWLVGGVVALAGGLVYADLASRRPQVGGQYVFLREAYHPVVAFLYGWALLWIVQSGGLAAVAVIFGQYFTDLVHLLGEALGQRGLDGPLVQRLVAFPNSGVVPALTIGTFALINCAGVRAAGTAQNVFMVLKILAIAMLVVCGLALASGPSSRGLAAATSQPLPHATGAENAWQQLSAFGAALVSVFFAYGGWHTATFVAGEVSNPRRTVPLGLVLGVSGVIALYVAVNFVCLRVLGPQTLARTRDPAAAVMRQALGRPGAALISLGIALSALGFVSQATLTSPRVYYAMAQDRLFFERVARVHPRTRVPVAAILLQGLVAIVIAVSGTFAQIVNYVMSVEMCFLALTALSLFVIRRRDAGAAEPGRVAMPGHPVTTLLFVGVNLAVLVNLLYKFPVNSAVGLGIALAGVPVYLFWRRWYRA